MTGGEVDAVVFDAGGVLLLPDVAVVHRGLQEYGVHPTADELHRVHYALNSWIDAVDELDWHEVDRRAAALLGVPADHIDAGCAVIRHAYTGAPWVPIEGAAETLRAIAERGHLLAIVSNAHGTMEDQLASHEICSTRGHPAARVEIVVDSAVVGVEKPDPRIFGYALDALGVPAERCLYVGDTVRFDVNGARAAGLVPVHVDPYDMCGADDHDHVSSVRDVAELLPEAAGVRAIGYRREAARKPT